MWHGHIINKRKDGTLYEEEATISPVRDASGKTVNYVAVKRDVTRESQLEIELRQAQKMESVGRLAGGVAHDFNNLLMGIMSYVELCQDEISPGHPIRAYLDEITHAAERSADLTRQLLAFASKQTIAPKILDLNDAVSGMLKLLRRLIGEDINLVWKPGAVMRPVKLDPAQIDQILANLCVNARDAIAGVGEITLETGVVTLDDNFCARCPEAIPGRHVFLTVSDNGCGMDKDTMAQIFEPFFTTKGIGNGTGLGLATVYGIVKQNNGFICVTSEPGKGTAFNIYLPQVVAGAVTATATIKAETPRGRGEAILLVEDEKFLRVTCGAFLNTLGYKALVAETPGEALKLAAGYPDDIHVLLTDVVMPGMDGRQLAKSISAFKPGVKVLFMSGYTRDVIAQRGVLDEGVQFLSKPFTRDDLARKLREVLE
ncbi:MAG: ATP-binding protein [bacterium]